MNTPADGRTATVKDIAEATGASRQSVQDVILKIERTNAEYPALGIRVPGASGGKPRREFRDHEVALISEELKKAHNADPSRQAAVTDLEMEKRTLEVMAWHRHKLGILEAENAQLKIKADVADTIAAAEGLILLSDAGKQICGHPLKFIQWAEESGLVFRRKKGGPLLPYAEYDKKYFRLTSRTVGRDLREQLYLTPRGLTWITGKYNAHHFRLNLDYTGGAA